MISGGGSLSFLSFGAAMVDVCVHHGGREELVLLSGDAICLQRDNLSRMMQKIWFRWKLDQQKIQEILSEHYSAKLLIKYNQVQLAQIVEFGDELVVWVWAR